MMHDITTFVTLAVLLLSMYFVVTYIGKLNDPKQKKRFTLLVVSVFSIVIFLIFTGAFKFGGDQKKSYPTVRSFDSERSTDTSYNKSIDQRYQNKDHEKADSRLNQLIKDLNENN